MKISLMHRMIFSIIRLGLLSVLVASCGLTPRIPIQMSRVAQMEMYEQIFVVNHQVGDTPEASVEADEKCNENTITYFDGVFFQMVGPKNWRNLSAVYGLPEICSELLAGTISLKGSLNFIVYLLAGDHDRFEIEGSGHYFLIRKSEDYKIMLAGDFLIAPTLHSIDDLRRGYLDIPIQLITTKVLLADTYLHQSDLRYRIFIDTSQADKNTYAIDYSRKHEAYLGDELFGVISLADSSQNTKLLDLRGTGFLQSDYNKE